MKRWKKALGNIRLLGPDVAQFAADVKLVWDYIEELEKKLNPEEEKKLDG